MISNTQMGDTEMRTSQAMSQFPFNVTPIRPLLLSLLATVLSGPLYAQQTPDEEIDEVVVVGTRQIIQSAIDIKRNSVEIADGLSGADIGDLPALSIGEALETVTGISAHRENGGVTEVAIRGLGPFLSHTTFNGRDVTNGDGDRAINFSQFPSELMNKLVVYKTQDASLVEGGVAGLIWLETLKPLDYDNRRFQANIKGNFNPDQQDISDPMQGDLGYRATLSYVDQFDLDNGGRIGISLGFQSFSSSQPESEVRSSSPTGTSRFACINEPNVLWEGFFASSTDNCEDQVSAAPYPTIDPNDESPEDNQGYNTRVDPATGLSYSDGLAWAFAPSSRGYRQNDTSDERDAFFAAVQFQPNDRLDINLDIQASERVREEETYDLNFGNMRRSITGVTGDSLVVSRTGGITSMVSQHPIESNSRKWDRDEDYLGGGLAFEFDVSDRLTISADASFSETQRVDKEITVRMQSDDQDIFNEDTPAQISGCSPGGGDQLLVSWNMDTGIPQYTVCDFDITDPTLYSDRYRARIDSDADTTNTITALRGDFELRDLAWESFTSIEGGFRISEMEFLSLAPTRYQPNEIRDNVPAELAAIPLMNEACRNPAFPQSSFLSNVASGDLVTVIDSSTGQPTTGTGNSWATFDPVCITNEILAFEGESFAYPENPYVDPFTIDVTETTLAGYVKANYETEILGKPVYGNFGVRVLNTEIESIGFRTEYEILTDDLGFLSMQPVPGADLERVVAKDDYNEVLPSFSAVMEISDDVLLRAGVFRGLSRAEYKALGFRRTFSINNEDDITEVNDLISNVSGFGNPFTQPLPSWNYDLSLEWYPGPDTILAAGIYYKRFEAGFEQARSTETFTVDGQSVNADFTVTQNSGDKSELYGVELTGAYRFSNLPGIFSGLGTKISYNYADSDFQFEDSLYGRVVILDDNGDVFSRTSRIVAPGNVPGFSEHVFSGQAYWEIGDFDLQLIYKYRSEYFHPYLSNGTRLRYVGDNGRWEARASYQLNRNWRLSLEALNLTDEPKHQYFFVRDDLGEVNSYGPRIFFGVRAKYW
jgi:TonB-dependent receptor